MLTPGLYDVILADPPWKFVTRSAKGLGRAPERHYSTMTPEAIRALPVGDLAAPDCALFLWGTWPTLLRDVPELLRAWGFEYKSCAFLWVKANPKGGGFFTGLGYYTRANTEPCLLAIRGRKPVAAHNVPQVIYSPIRAHSQKPDETYSRIEALYPGQRYLELFARRRGGESWATWGNQAPDGLDLMPSDPPPGSGQAGTIRPFCGPEQGGA